MNHFWKEKETKLLLPNIVPLDVNLKEDVPKRYEIFNKNSINLSKGHVKNRSMIIQMDRHKIGNISTNKTDKKYSSKNLVNYKKIKNTNTKTNNNNTNKANTTNNNNTKITSFLDDPTKRPIILHKTPNISVINYNDYSIINKLYGKRNNNTNNNSNTNNMNDFSKYCNDYFYFSKFNTTEEDYLNNANNTNVLII